MKRIGKPICFIWYSIRGSNEMLGVKNVEKWRLGDLSRRGTSRWKVPCQNAPALAGWRLRQALSALTYPGNYPESFAFYRNHGD